MFSDIKKSFLLLDEKNRFNYFFLLIFIVFGALLEISSIYLIYKLIIVITDSSFNAINGLVNLFNNETIKFSLKVNFQTFLIIIISLFLFKFIYFIALYFSKYYFVNYIRVKLSSSILKNYLQKKNNFYTKNKSSVLIRNVENEVAQYANGILQPMLIVFSELFMLVGILIFLTLTNPIIVLICFILLFLASQIYFFSIKKILSDHGHRRQKFTGKVLATLMETFQGLKVLKIFNAENFFYKKYIESAKKLARSNIIVGSFTQVPKFGLEFLIVFLIIIFLFYVSSSQSINFAFDTLALLAVSSFKLIPSISRILFSLQNMRFNKASLNVLSKEIGKAKNLKNLKFNFKAIEFNNKIEFKNVYFKYANSEVEILKNINLKIKKGSSIGIIGESGAGKSTFIDLLMGFIEPTKGKIYIDNHNLKQIKYGWMKLIGYVPQKLFLTDDTIKQNIAFGVDPKKINEKMVENAIKMSQLKKLTISPRDIYKENLGEQGSKISGGQIQRISLARSFYKDSQIYIFDEATNSLDDITEKKVLKTVKKIVKNKTLIIISHKKETLAFCNNIFIIKNSRLKKIK